MIRRYHVVAIPIRIVVNTFGDHNPNGMMYVLKENEQKVKDLVRKNPFTPVDLVEPLVIRANEGDTVEVLFENKQQRQYSCARSKCALQDPGGPWRKLLFFRLGKSVKHGKWLKSERPFRSAGGAAPVFLVDRPGDGKALQ